MTEDKDSEIVPPSGGVFGELWLRVRLIGRLMADGRVSPLIKLLPVGSLFYFLFPDLAPGPIDDMAVMWLGAYLFVELCPPDVVQEHMEAMRQVLPGEWRDAPVSEPHVVHPAPTQLDGQAADQIIDGEFKDREN
jgi:hypothetical protein